MLLFARLNRLFLLAVLLAFAPLAAHALPLQPPTGFSTAGQGLSPEGLLFNPVTQTLFASDDSTLTNIFEYELDGTPVGTPIQPGLADIRGLSVRADNGNILYAYVSGFDSRGVIEYLPDFVTPAVGGINFTVPCNGFCGSTGEDLDFEAVDFHAARNSVWVADDGRGLLLEYDLSGNELNRIVTENLALAAGVEVLDGPSGLVIDQLTGNLIVTDDSSGGNGRIFEMTPDGVVLDATDNALFTAMVGVCAASVPNFTCIDGEGAAFDQVNRILFLAFEFEQVITSAQVPEPTSLAFLALALLVGQARRTRRS